MKRYAVYAALTFCLELLSCSGPVDLSGTSGTGNSFITGKIYTDCGDAAKQTIVQILHSNFNPANSVSLPVSTFDTTDNGGNYVFRGIDSGFYSIQAVDMNTRKRVLISDIFIKGDSVTIPSDTLRIPGKIKIQLTVDFNASNGYIYIPGTTIITQIGNNNYVLLDSVPAGKISAIYYSTANNVTSPQLIRDSITVAPGETVPVAYTNWKYSKKLIINTTSSGADVSGDVVNFPLLVRLNSDNFNFFQTRPNGEDIRFTKSDGVPLQYEIDQWDTISKSATIWVKVDTVHGNDNSQSLTMLWGNTSAASQSNSASVFDTADGFQGVWHLSEAGNTIAKDATGNHYDGTPSDTAPTSAEGTIGPCRSFNGSSNYIRMNGTANSKLNFPENGTYTVSAWVYVDSLDNGYHLIAGKSNEQYYLKFKFSNQNIKNSPMVWEFVDYYDKTGYNITNSLPSVPQAKVWNYIVGIRKGTQQYLYIDGKLTDSTSSLNSWVAPRNTGDDFTIGKFISAPADTTGGKCPFLGKIDEVQISNSAYNADWIKLSFMNQKEPDGLIKW